MNFCESHLLRKAESILHRRLTPVIYKVHERLSGRHFWGQAQALLSLQWQPPEVLQARAVEKLRKLLGHAYEQVPYYRDMFRQRGLVPRDIQSLNEFSRLPITTKRELRANFPEHVVAANLPAQRRRLAKTSGSSGIPLEFYTDEEARDIRVASHYFFEALSGVSPTDSHVVITSPRPPQWSAQWERVRRFLTGSATIYLSVFDTTATRLREVLRRLSAYYLQGYPSYIARLARQLIEQGIPLEIYPKVVLVGSETMTPLEGEQITQGFCCPVRSHYASFEFLHMAIQCPDHPDHGLHVNSESVLIEIVTEDGRPAGVGERGQVIVTDLHNYVMPFIRYDIGDTAIAGGPCPCGRGLPTLQCLEGRTSEHIRTPSGTIITSGVLGTLLLVRRDFLASILEYQAIQAAPDTVVFKLVPSGRFERQVEIDLRAALRDLLGPEMSVEFDLVKTIPTESNGKRLVIKSLQ